MVYFILPKACNVARLVTEDGNEIKTDIFVNSVVLKRLPSLWVEAITKQCEFKLNSKVLPPKEKILPRNMR